MSIVKKFVDRILISIEATTYCIMLCLGSMIETILFLSILMIVTIEERCRRWQHRWRLWRIKKCNPDIQELSVLSGIDKSKVKKHD